MKMTNETALVEPTKEEVQLKRITLAEKAIAEAATKVDDLKAELKEAKATHDAAVAKLRRIIRDDYTSEAPLFEKDGSQEGNAGDDSVDVDKTTTVELDEDDNSWKKVVLSTLAGLTDSILKKLSEAEIFTMGDLVEWTDTKGKYLQDIKGVGKAAAKKIEDATIAFWESRETPVETTECESEQTEEQPGKETAVDSDSDSDGELDVERSGGPEELPQPELSNSRVDVTDV